MSYPDVQTRIFLVSNWMELGWATLNLCRLAIFFVGVFLRSVIRPQARFISWNLVCYAHPWLYVTTADNNYLWRPRTKCWDLGSGYLHSGLAELQPNFSANTRAKVDTSNYIYWARCIFVNHIVDAPSKLSQECYAHPWLYVTTADDDNLWRPRIKRWGFAS